MNKLSLSLLVVFVCTTLVSIAQVDLAYQEPPQEIKAIAEVPPPPYVSVDDSGENMLLMYRPAFTSIEELSRTEYRIAGLRINPETFGQSRTRYFNDLKILRSGQQEPELIQNLPQNSKISDVSWSKDYAQIAFTNTTANKIELWVIDVKNASAKIIASNVNDVFRGYPYAWDPEGNGFLVKMRDTAKEEPAVDPVPKGPVIQENLGTKAPSRTYQDLLKNKNDEMRFDYYSSSKLMFVDFDGNAKGLNVEGIISEMSYSPDGTLILVKEIHQPFSYLVPYYRFPYATSVYGRSGKLVKTIFDAPLEEDRPKGFMATSKGPRYISWRTDKPATLYWVEALDEGDPSKKVDHRDAVYTWEAPFESQASEFTKTEQRYYDIEWGNEDVALVYDYWWNRRSRRVFSINPSDPASGLNLIFDLDTEDLYGNPGSFVTTQNKYGKSVLLMSGARTLYLKGEGYSPEGNRPFIDAFDIKTKTKQQLWRADGKETYERIIDVIDIKKGELLTTVETSKEYPNYYIRNIYKRIAPIRITNFPNPYESMEGVSHQVLKYKRNDGTELTAQLYLPAGYDKEKDGRLPVFLWAYPREYKNAAVAGQVKSSPHRFTRISYGSPIFWVNRGYAVLDRTDFPIVGEGDKEPNDTFVEQLVANADAAITTLSDMGIADPQRVGVGGHSYGAFMTANLLAHSDLFAAGIARSGAYNRSLTPFGFQREERTFWEAPEIYFRMSPFMHANKINEPLLMVHGVADNNSGTFPMQSERMYNAIKGHGGTTRLVMLPYESHGYAARESIMHMLWEMDSWLETYVKNRDKLGENSQKILNNE